MEELTLSNGLRIVHKHSDSAVGYCGFMVDCGSRNETSPELFGIAHFIEHILFKGTKILLDCSKSTQGIFWAVGLLSYMVIKTP